MFRKTQIIMHSYLLCRAICTDKHTQCQPSLHPFPISSTWHVAILCQQAERKIGKWAEGQGTRLYIPSKCDVLCRCMERCEEGGVGYLVEESVGRVHIHLDKHWRQMRDEMVPLALMLKWEHFGHVTVVDVYVLVRMCWGKPVDFRADHMGGT